MSMNTTYTAKEIEDGIDALNGLLSVPVTNDRPHVVNHDTAQTLVRMMSDAAYLAAVWTAWENIFVPGPKFQSNTQPRPPTNSVLTDAVQSLYGSNIMGASLNIMGATTLVL
jgi:hypothetical protein